jgi:steroid 5-alpha reductase family enzyme
MSPLPQTLLFVFVTIQLAMSLLWLLSVARRDASIVDPFWGTGFVLVAWMAWGMNAPVPWRVTLLAVLTTIWGLRLSGYLLWRNWGEGEDRRYAAMRRHHGARFWWVSLGTVFLLQGVILWFVSLPLQAAAASKTSTALSWLDAIGIVVWLIGFTFESVGDWQLARFRADPANAGRVMDRGLWRYTRHPNYFGDFCVWWGLYLISASGGGAWTIGSPCVMSFFLLRVSGVKLLERDIADRRPEYAAYKSRTNAFFPGPPTNRRTVRQNKNGVEK